MNFLLMSNQLFEQMRQDQIAWRELEWIALHYEEATVEQRAHLDRVLQAIDEQDA